MNVLHHKPSDTGTRDDVADRALRRAFSESPLGRGIEHGVDSDTMLEVVLAVLIAASAFIAALPALYAYKVPGATALIMAAACGSTAVAYAAARIWRLSAAASYLLSALGVVLLLLIADGPHFSSVAEGLSRGPNRLLTETLPLSGGRSTISALVVVVWVCGATTSESLIRTARRRASAPVALVLPLGLYLLCFAVSTPAPGRDHVGGPLLLVTVAVAAAIRLQITTPTEVDRDIEVRPPSRFRAGLSGVIAAAVVAVLLAGLAPAVPALRGHPGDLRRRPPTIFPVITDPVDAMEQLRDGAPHSAPVNELSVTMSVPSTGYLAMGDLDEYDGGQWRFNATFHPTGGRVPAAEAPGRVLSTTTVSQHVVITGSLPVPLLPALDRSQTVSGLAVDTDPATGMLLPAEAAGRLSYVTVSSSPSLTLLALPPADGIAHTEDADDLAIPPDTAGDLATAVRFVAGLTGDVRPSSSLAFMQAVAQALQAGEKRVDPNAAPSNTKPTTPTTLTPTSSEGTSLSEVINAVTVNRAATPEQFSTFYAMVARYLGVPARVVTGFRLAKDSSGGPVAAGTFEVTNRQAWAWVEIPVAGIGWVVCDPTPDATTAEASAPPESVSAPATTVPLRQANAVPKDEIAGGHALAPPGHPYVSRSTPASRWLTLMLVLLGVGLVLLLTGPGQAGLRRAWRRRCRRSPDPKLLAVGAWLELLDGLDRAGMHPASGATASEVANDVGHHFGPQYAEQAATVAAVADRAVFSTADPLPPEAATVAWQASRDLRRRVFSTLDTRQRVRSWLVVGSAAIRPSGSQR